MKLSTAWNSIHRSAICAQSDTVQITKYFLTTPYTAHVNLKSMESMKYLGVTLTKDLTWGKHVDNIRAKTNQQQDT